MLVQLKISGKVQGVFFRQSTCKLAKLLDISGWVKNEADGSVLILAYGDKGQLESLINWCWEGSARACVTNVEVQWLDKDNQEIKEGFIISY